MDIVRVLLALLVYLYHSRIHLGCDYGFLNPLVEAGNLAMTGFFMLSGYSIQMVYGNKTLSSRNELWSFYKRRFFAIYPMYFVVGGLYVIMNTAMGVQSLVDNIVLAPVELLGLQAFFPMALFQYSHNSGTWFVSCLLLCYFMFPFLKIFPGKLNKKNTIILTVVLIVLLIYSMEVCDRFTTLSLYTNPFFRLLEFIVGLLLSNLREEDMGFKKHPIVILDTVSKSVSD